MCMQTHCMCTYIISFTPQNLGGSLAPPSKYRRGGARQGQSGSSLKPLDWGGGGRGGGGGGGSWCGARCQWDKGRCACCATHPHTPHLDSRCRGWNSGWGLGWEPPSRASSPELLLMHLEVALLQGRRCCPCCCATAPTKLCQHNLPWRQRCRRCRHSSGRGGVGAAIGRRQGGRVGAATILTAEGRGALCCPLSPTPTTPTTTAAAPRKSPVESFPEGGQAHPRCTCQHIHFCKSCAENGILPGW